MRYKFNLTINPKISRQSKANKLYFGPKGGNNPNKKHYINARKDKTRQKLNSQRILNYDAPPRIKMKTKISQIIVKKTDKILEIQ